ncbi:MAG: hypothetical protein FJ387_20190 [Verrucomicrobia bacterium]|nr:hypothetical protein [Verrucomicrobiota bacterium]
MSTSQADPTAGRSTAGGSEPTSTPQPWGAPPEEVPRGLTPVRFAVLLAVLLGLAFPEVWSGGRSFFYRDFGVLAYPTIYHHREAFWRGELPLWNPLSNCGVPFLAQWGTMTLYPGTLIYLLLPLPWSLNVFCLVHLWLAGFGMYSLARRWTGHPLAAGLAGVAFVFNGVTLSCLLWPNYCVALGWMPWVVLWLERAGRNGGRAVALAALAGALQLLAGVPELTLMTWLVAGALGLGALLQERRPAPNPPAVQPPRPENESPAANATGPPASPPPLRTLCRWAGAFGLALCLTAAQWLPFLELLARSQRDASFATAKWALPTWAWANLWVPLLHCFETTQGVFFQHGQEFFSSIYLGLSMVALAGFALGRVRAPRVWLLGALAVLALALAVGEASPLYRGLKAVLPAAGLARYPVKWVLLVSFIVPLLGAFAVARLFSPPAVAARRQDTVTLWLSSLAVVVLGAGAAAWAGLHPLPLDQPGRMGLNLTARVVFGMGVLIGLCWAARAGRGRLTAWVSLGALVLFWADGLTHTPRQNPTVPARLLEPGMLELPDPPRVGAGRVFITPAAEQALLHSRVADFEQDLLGKRLALWSHLNLLEAVPKINGSATLQIREQAQVQALLYASPATQHPALLDFLGATYMSAPDNPVEWVARAGALPLVTAGQAAMFVDARTSLALLAEAEFEARQAVCLPEEVRAHVTTGAGASAAVLDLHAEAHRLRFTVDAAEPAWVVVAQSYYPCWQATVNGRPVPLYRANHAFQALEVPAGRAMVDLRYSDRRFRWGVAFSVAGLMACGVIGILGRRSSGPGARVLEVAPASQD